MSADNKEFPSDFHSAEILDIIGKIVFAEIAYMFGDFSVLGQFLYRISGFTYLGVLIISVQTIVNALVISIVQKS